MNPCTRLNWSDLVPIRTSLNNGLNHSRFSSINLTTWRKSCHRFNISLFRGAKADKSVKLSVCPFSFSPQLPDSKLYVKRHSESENSAGWTFGGDCIRQWALRRPARHDTDGGAVLSVSQRVSLLKTQSSRRDTDETDEWSVSWQRKHTNTQRAQDIPSWKAPRNWSWLPASAKIFLSRMEQKARKRF